MTVGVLHFVMMPKLLSLIVAHGGDQAAAYIVPMFYINHLGSGVFLLVLGFALILCGRVGIPQGERWAAWLTVAFCAGLLCLVALLIATLPSFFLSARYFCAALCGLATVGLLGMIPVLAKWRSFHA